MNIFDSDGLGLGARGPVPPNVKGPEGVDVTRTLEDMRSWPNEVPEEQKKATRRSRAVPPPADLPTGNEGNPPENARHYLGHAGRHEEGHQEPQRLPGEPHFRGRAMNDQKPKHFRGRPVEPARTMGYGDGEERRKRWYPDQ